MHVDKITSKFDDVYRKRYAEFGDDHRALGWPNREHVCIRHRVMAGIIDWGKHRGNVRLLDFGCGLGHFLDCIQMERIDYIGVDIVAEFLQRCIIKYPETEFLYLDVMRGDRVPASDYTIVNGVFTQKLDVPFDDMWDYFTHITKILFDKAEHGIAFNVMSTHVDWERDDLFHVPMDRMADFVIDVLGTRNFTMRNDYGLYEYTTYVYR